ncbi:MAG: MerR family transcriptional regulator [Patescibacteria group bacterium]|jgi:hypothetical protein
MERELLNIGETAKILGITQQTLRRWDKKGILTAIHPSGSQHRYYRPEDIQVLLLSRDDIVQASWRWATAEPPVEPASMYYCQTRDVFTARWERLVGELARIVLRDDGQSNLIAGIASEIGNNSFDHNIGNWPDIPGVFFGYDLKRREIVLADRGRGILTTLRQTRPELKNDLEAVEMAFTKAISGRAPETRGNGLKFVKAAVRSGTSISLVFQSGVAQISLMRRNSHLSVRVAHPAIQGCLAIINF